MKRYLPLVLLFMGCEESFREHWPLPVDAQAYLFTVADTTRYITSSEPDTALWDTLWMVRQSTGIQSESGGALPPGFTSEKLTFSLTDTALGPVLEMRFFNHPLASGYTPISLALTGLGGPITVDSLPPTYLSNPFQDSLVLGTDTLFNLLGVGTEPRFFLRKNLAPRAIQVGVRIYLL